MVVVVPGVADAFAFGIVPVTGFPQTETLPTGSAAATVVAPTVRYLNTQTAAVAGAAAAAVDVTVAWSYTVSPAVAAARARANPPYTELIRDRGREPIAVDQPHAGSSYPFRKQGTELGNLVADAYLAYEDAAETHPRPFKIGMLYGFGTTINSAPTSFSEATHDYDIVVLDADDEIVFDSTALDADRVLAQYWDDRLLIVQWTADDAVCRVAIFTSWSPNDSPTPFDIYRTPTDALLDDRALERLPRRVRSIRVGIHRLTATDVELQPGYNSDVAVGAGLTVGVRRQTAIETTSSPGDGLGRFNNCEEQVPTIRRIDSVAADDRGNFRLDAAGCYRVGRPQTIENGTATPTPATQRLTNDCGPCADCDDYIRVYEAVRKLYARYLAIGRRAEAVRDKYAANKARWDAEASCRRNNRLKISASTSCPCLVALAVGYCNSTDDTECLTGLELRISFAGAVVSTGSAQCGKAYRSGNVEGDCPPPSVSCNTNANIIVPYVPGGTWPELRMSWDAVKPNGMAVGTFQLEFPACSDRHRNPWDFTELGAGGELVYAQELSVTAEAWLDGVLVDSLSTPLTLTPTNDIGDCC